MIINESDFNHQWATKTLNELGTFSRGKSRHRPRNDKSLFEKGTFPLIQTGEVRQANLYIRSHSEAYNDFGLKQSKIWPENTLCITIAANIAETALLAYPMCFPDSVVGFTAYPNESSELMMHYVFAYIRKTIQAASGGSIQNNISIDYLSNLKFKIPTKPYQDRIVDVLASIDRMIELNNNIQSNLDEIAQKLYRYWFVQFDFPDERGNPYKSSGREMYIDRSLGREIPKSWRVSRLGKETKVYLGGTPSTTRSDYWDGGTIPWASSSETVQFPLVSTDQYITQSGLSNSAAKLMKSGTIAMSIVRYIRPTILGIDAAANQSVVGIDETEVLKKSYLYNAVNSHVPIFLSRRTGAQQPHINRDEVANMPIVIPGDDLTLKKFYATAEPIYDYLVVLKKANAKLTTLRDWLLPMLMNGQVEITEGSSVSFQS